MAYVITLFKTKTQKINCAAIAFFKKKGSVVNKKKVKKNKHLFVFFFKKCIYILF